MGRNWELVQDEGRRDNIYLKKKRSGYMELEINKCELAAPWNWNS